MKPRIFVLAFLWTGSLAGAWWLGHRNGTDTAITRFATTREAADGPGKPSTPGQGGSKATAAQSGAGTAGAPGTPTGPQSLQSILAQVKNLMRSGGMQNPSAMLKTVTLLGQIRDEDIQAALKEAADFKDPQSQMMVNMMLLSRWAESDGPGALKYAEENLAEGNPMAKQMAKMGVLSAWAQSDPDAAWAHLKSSEDEDTGGSMFGGRSMMMMGLFSSMAAKDPDKAFARLAELDEPQERQMALNGIAQTAYDDASRSRLMEEISKLPDANERKEARSAILGQLAMMDPDQAVKMTATLPADERKEASQRVGTMLMMSDPERGAAYMLENAEPNDKKQVYQQIVSQWVHADANKAGAWLGQQPQTPDLDGARFSFATQVAGRDPESAMAWANTVTEENQRTLAVEQVYKTWKQKDEPAASAALQSSGLSQDRIDAIRTGIPRATTTPTAITVEPAPGQ